MPVLRITGILPVLLTALVILGTLLLKTQLVRGGEWRRVKEGKPYGISGIALVRQQGDFSSFLVVHDNKLPDQGRLALVDILGGGQPEYIPLQWPADVARPGVARPGKFSDSDVAGASRPEVDSDSDVAGASRKEVEMPIDLEALTVVPGVGLPTFMAATSRGRIYHLQLNADNSLSILKIFDLPNLPPGSNLEGFALQYIDELLVAVYAHRGAGTEPGVIYWGVLELHAYELSQQGSIAIEVPWPEGPVRHVSDLKVDPAGILFISSATDTGDDGPFESAVYVVGAFAGGDRQIQFRHNPSLTPLYRFDFHKIEALEFVPGKTGGLIVGTDDENMGGSLFPSW